MTLINNEEIAEKLKKIKGNMERFRNRNLVFVTLKNPDDGTETKLWYNKAEWDEMDAFRKDRLI